LFHPAGSDRASTSIADVWAQAATVIAGKVLAEAQGVPVLVETS
jgi:hypothetical protein